MQALLWLFSQMHFPNLGVFQHPCSSKVCKKNIFIQSTGYHLCIKYMNNSKITSYVNKKKSNPSRSCPFKIM